MLIVSGSSGAGKSTFIKKLLKENPEIFSFSTSHTTRKPRKKELNGLDYWFVDHQKFQEMIENNEFIEFEKNYVNNYGTSKAEIKSIQGQGLIPVLDLDSKGLINVIS